MISRDLTITVNNNTASLSEPVTVYRGDRGIVLNCKIMQYKFKFNRSSLENVINRSTGIVYARVLVHRPSATDCFEVPMAAVDNDIVVITITKEWLDEEIEIGTYKLQIQLYGEDYENERITIPPVEFNVEDTLCSTPDNFNVFSDKVGVAVAGLLEINENGEAYNSDYANGVYNETKWGSGDIVTANALNKMEDAIDYSVDAIHQLDMNHDSDINALRNELNAKIDSQDTGIRNSINILKADIENDINELDDRKADIDYVDGIDSAINGMLSNVTSDISGLRSSKADNTYVQTEISELEAQIAAVEGNVQVNANDIDTLEQNVTNLQSILNDLQSNHESDIQDINSKINGELFNPETTYNYDLLTESKTMVGAINEIYKMIYQIKNGLPYPKNEYYVEYTLGLVDSNTELLTAIQDGHEDDGEGSYYKYLPYALDLSGDNIEILYGNDDNYVVISGHGLNTVLAKSVKKIRIYYPSNLDILQAAFQGRNIRTIEHINMSNIKWAGSMFANCSELITVNGMERLRNVEDVHRMFYNCSSLYDVNLSRLDTSGLYSDFYYENMLTGVPSHINWHHDSSNSNSYAKFTLTEEETGFSGTFPWNK